MRSISRAPDLLDPLSLSFVVSCVSLFHQLPIQVCLDLIQVLLSSLQALLCSRRVPLPDAEFNLPVLYRSLSGSLPLALSLAFSPLSLALSALSTPCLPMSVQTVLGKGFKSFLDLVVVRSNILEPLSSECGAPSLSRPVQPKHDLIGIGIAFFLHGEFWLVSCFVLQKRERLSSLVHD